MNTISVSLDTNYQDFINSAVLSGRYRDTDEVVRVALMLLKERERKIKNLRSAVEEGIQSGFYDDFDLDSHLEKMKLSEYFMR